MFLKDEVIQSSEKAPLVSVVIPCYNHQNYVEECISSIINQGYRNIELIIIDDGSSDDSVRIIQKLRPECQDRFIRFEFIARSNQGLCATLNQAIEWCEGKYFSAVASDDVWMPFKTAQQVKFLEENPNISAVFGGIVLIDKDSRFIRKIERHGVFSFQDIFLNRHFLPAPTALIRLNQLRDVGYDPNIKIEDWNMWLKLTRNCDASLVTLKQSVAFYRQHGSSVSRDVDFMYEQGIRILAQFRSDKNYDRAMAAHELSFSSICAFKDKRRAVHHFLLYLRARKYSARAFSVLGKILIPNSLVRYQRSICSKVVSLKWLDRCRK